MKREVWSGSQLRGLQEVGIGPGGELVEEPAEAGGKPWGALCESRGSGHLLSVNRVLGKEEHGELWLREQKMLSVTLKTR